MVIAYLRVSTGKQFLTNQKSEIIRYMANKNISIDRWVEETISGKTNQSNRKLGELINNLKRGDTLIVTEVSRLSRSLHEIMVIMKYCIDTGVTIYSTKDGYAFDDSLNSKVLSFAFGLSAEIEHKLISQRTREALAVRKAAGKHVGRAFGTDYLYQEISLLRADILSSIDEGLTINEICVKFGFSRTIFAKLREEYCDVNNAIKKRNKRIGNRWGNSK